METDTKPRTIRDLVALRKSGLAYPNPEYQRGVVWSEDQQMKLIDSVMRGYQLPIIYLHDIQIEIAGRRQDRYHIIDGQQRLEALCRFVDGAFTLYRPDDAKARFPRFLLDRPCPWGGKDFHGLPEALREDFLDKELQVAVVRTDDENEVRDLFVRLQSGLPLNDQEKRDSYPGQFTQFILRLGGKPQADLPGHSFFRHVLRMNPANDRGRTRRLAAQIAILFLNRRAEPQLFCDINKRALDDYYYANLDFDSSREDCRRLSRILDKLTGLFGDGKRPKLLGHNAIHLVLFVDSILDSYTRAWEDSLPDAHDEFSAELTHATADWKKGESNETPPEAWVRYGIWTRSNSDRGENIRRRHQFYSDRMTQYLGASLVPKDPKRVFGPLEREQIYWRDNKKCAVCGAEVPWSEAEIHHLDAHGEGGRTALKNGVLVHRACHPKGEQARRFAEKFRARQQCVES